MKNVKIHFRTEKILLLGFYIVDTARVLFLLEPSLLQYELDLTVWTDQISFF